jgi:hypothetical protein
MGKSTPIRNLIGFIPETVKIVAISIQAARALALLAHLCELSAGEIGGAAGPPPLAPPTIRRSSGCSTGSPTRIGRWRSANTDCC